MPSVIRPVSLKVFSMLPEVMSDQLVILKIPTSGPTGRCVTFLVAGEVVLVQGAHTDGGADIAATVGCFCEVVRDGAGAAGGAVAGYVA